jgi:amino acid adenylation domain-containing protein
MKINIIEYLEHTVLENPDKTAIVDGDTSYTFRELRSAAQRLAASIISCKDIRLQPVLTYLPKSAATVISNLAAIYSGNIYSNLDIKSPDQRVWNIITNLNPGLIITHPELKEKLLAIGVSPDMILLFGEETQSTAQFPAEFANRWMTLIDTDPLCIINTSGSTGTPKGVVLNHRSFFDFTEWAIETLKIDGTEKIGSLSPFFFDIYSFEICLMMARSSVIHIIPDQLAIFPVKLVEFLRDFEINFIFWVPTIMVNIANLNLLDRISLPSMTKVLFAGEVFPTKHLNYWRRSIPTATFVNLYGPIEITLDCTYYIVERDFPDEEPIPIGFPCRNTDILILNDRNEPAGEDERGELCVRGTSLAMGYWNDPDKTSKAFTQNPLNSHYPELIYRTGDVVSRNAAGEILFWGRKDFQVKHLGYRIELSEIEHIVINTLPEMDNACIIYNFQKKEIVLFYESKAELAVSEIRRRINMHLPKYMLPTVFYYFKEMPRNPNGKIDRNLLKEKYLSGNNA